MKCVLYYVFMFDGGQSYTRFNLTETRNFVGFQAPNGMGGILGLAQLILYALYYNSTKRILAEREAKGEVGLAQKGDTKVPNNEP